MKSPLFFFSEWIIWAVERGNPYFARINFPHRFVRVMLQRVHHEKYICFPAALPSKTAEGRHVDLLQPFVSLAWQRPLCQCKCGGASPPPSPAVSPSFINDRDEPVAIGINAAFIRVLAAWRGWYDGRGGNHNLLSGALFFKSALAVLGITWILFCLNDNVHDMKPSLRWMFGSRKTW